MKQSVKRGLALLMTVVMCLSLIPTMALAASAAKVDYIYGTGEHSAYIYNWGTRGTDATSLSPNAESFYTKNNTTYAELSQLPGGNSISNAPSSDLYAALQKLMKDNHKTITSYDETRPLYQYTDCQNGGGKISAFYSGTEVGPAWDSGSTWNREHTWPNSKGLEGSDEDDIMMLRPTTTSENSSRGNKAYGESSGYYNPNTVSGGTYNLHGDVARIMLYVYVRWGNTEKMWGSDGVMESLDVLIDWMAEDPVDTWEMGRNDSVESITGTRNVFVDYPELAFLLFGEDIPNTLTTPSGEAKTHVNCPHQYQAGTPVPATCTAKGYTPYTCSLCQKVLKKDYTNMLDHTYVDGVCSCGAVEGPYYVTKVTAGTAYKLGLYSTAKSAEFFFTGKMSNYYGATDTSYDKGVDVYLEETSGGYYLYFMDTNNAKQYINLVLSVNTANNKTYYNFTFGSTADSVFTWDADKYALHTTVGTEDCYMGTYSTYVTMGTLRVSQMKDTDYIARLYTMGSSSGEGGETTCEHSWNDATCKDPKTCSKCGATEGEKSNEHNYVSGTCTVCGQADPNAGGETTNTTVAVSIADYADANGWTNGTQYPSLKMDDVVTVTASGDQNTGKYYTKGEQWRMYQTEAPSIVVSGGDKTIVSVKITYVAEKTGALTYNGVNVASGTKVDVNATSATFGVGNTGTATNGQVRITAIEVVYENGNEPECQHDWDNATCTLPKTCSKCGETEGEALGHSWNDATCEAPKTCGTCGATEGSALGHTYAKSMTTAPTCTNAGIVIYTCTRCGNSNASAIPARGHVWVNGICSVCGEKNQSSEGMNSAQLCGGGKDCILHAFSDINVGAWYHDGVHYCVEHALFQGLPGGKFGPTETTTRAQLITILWRLEGSPVVNYLMDFDDVESDQWYTEAVRWAAAEKIVGGYGNGLFGINDAITREQMATILWRYAQYKKQDVSVGENTNILSYGDVAQVNEYAIPAMQWACGAGLIQGIAADNTMNLDPAGSANRAQVATILYRYCEKPAK